MRNEADANLALVAMAKPANPVVIGAHALTVRKPIRPAVRKSLIARIFGR